MKQSLILALFAFVMAVAGATWFSVSVAPERPPVVVDSNPARPVAEADLTASGASDPTPMPALLTGTDSAPTAAVPVAADLADAVESAVDPRGAREVAKILITMKPKAAADIMAKLTDDEVEKIVRQLNAKQVATLLGALPQERAALLSRRLLTPSASGRGGT